MTSPLRLIIRPFSEGDPAEAARLLSSSRAEYLRWFGPFQFDATVIGNLAFSAVRDQWFTIEVEQGGGYQFAGFYTLRGVDEGFADPMYGVFIGEAFSGKGIARLTVAHAEAQCRLNGWKTLLLKADPRNRRAFDIYTRAGFQYVRTDPKNGDQVLAKTVLP